MQINFETHPDQYKHLKLNVDESVATIKLAIQEDEGLKPGYALKLNSYDLSVDIELADAVTRLRFEHPEVGAVIITGDVDGVFSSGANIFMLGSSTHHFKVNFCKYTNETRLGIEDASANSGQKYIAAVNGICSGGGYELALACDDIVLVDDRRTAVALPEVPYLGVLPGTGGLTRLVDKRKVRGDLADVFCTVAEGVKGKRAKQWNLVDEVFPKSRFDEEVKKRALSAAKGGHPDRKGVNLEALQPTVGENTINYRHVSLSLQPEARTARIEIRGPQELPEIPSNANEPLSASWYPLAMTRELDDVLLRLRYEYPEIGVVLVSTKGSIDSVLKLDAQLAQSQDNWFVHEVTLLMKRVFKRMDLTAKSFFALVEKESCFAGSLFELALSCDRVYMRDEDGVTIALSELNAGALPMSNGLSRLATRLLADPEAVAALEKNREQFDAQAAEEAGLITLAVDDIDWDDDIRLIIEERVSFSPDSLTGLEANLRFAGPETVETKIFGRLSAWQNWIFQRPNAVGEHGAIPLYGQPKSPQFDWRRT